MTRSDSAKNCADDTRKPRETVKNTGLGPNPTSGTGTKIRFHPPHADHEFSLVIPAYNEENRLPWTLAELRRFLDASGIDYRVLVADDGSTDRTATLAPRMGSRFSTISLPQNRGKGAAVRNAMLRATGKVLAFTDADLPFELESLRQAYDLVCGGERRPLSHDAKSYSAPATWPNRPIRPDASSRGRSPHGSSAKSSNA